MHVAVHVVGVGREHLSVPGGMVRSGSEFADCALVETGLATVSAAELASNGQPATQLCQRITVRVSLMACGSYELPAVLGRGLGARLERHLL
jgi:hypothetical protein